PKKKSNHAVGRPHLSLLHSFFTNPPPTLPPSFPHQNSNPINQSLSLHTNSTQIPIPFHMTHRHRPPSSPPPPPPTEPTTYNIIPIHNLLADHPSLRFPEVRAATAALRSVGDLRHPPFIPWQPHFDLLDWLGAFFGFQSHNISNQREHLVLHLSNAQMRLQPPPNNIDSLDPSVLRKFRKNFIGCKSNIWISDSRRQISEADQRRELLYVAMILEDYIDENTGRPVLPSISGENAFLERVVKPIYDTVKLEVEFSRNGTAPHGNWRNYDDLNEYFWSRRCFEKLKWPIDIGSNFFATTSRGKRVGKTGFVEQRSFLNLFRSFDKLWIMLFMFLQAAIIVAWKDRKTYPWEALEDRDVQVKALLDVVMQYKLVSRETLWLGVRMALKIVTSFVWIIIFLVFYTRMWNQRNDDRRWSSAANKRVVNFLEVAFVFILPEILALVLFIIPWVRNFLENTNWKSKAFVGRGLREGLVDNIKYSLFWIAIKPMIQPTKAILDLDGVEYEWHQFFGNSNRFAVGLLWLPIWYSIYSSFVGAGVGLLSHLGEIRNVQQLRLRFQFFASAMQFNLMPEEQLLNTRGTLKSKFKDALHRFQLRYGFGTPFKKLDSNQIEAHKFALIWNEIILTFREEDIVSDREVELLELPQNTWNVSVVRWPCFLLANELLLALSQAKELVDAPDKWLWSKIKKHEYRRCSVIETYDSVRHLLLTIVQYNTQEHSIITTIFQEIDNSINIGKFTKTFNMYALPKIHNHLITLVGLLIKSKKDVNKVVNILQALYEVIIRDFFRERRSMNELKEDGLAPHRPLSGAGLLFENAVELPGSENENFYRQTRRLHTILTSRDSMNNIPVNLEARRRIAFFSNSLFMNIPHAPQVEKMMAFSVLTPYYNEEVVYSKEQLRTENEDGVSTLYYLQTIYADEWVNFLQRMKREGMVSEDELWTSKLRDLRLWASYRGQTLARTVRGMMYYYRALKMLAFLDSASEMDIREGARELVPLESIGSADGSSRSGRSLRRADSTMSTMFKGHEYGTALMKYTYVVACQIYGTQKARKDPHAEEILYLMKNNEALRVAYVDEVVKRDETDYYSVLVKYDQELEKEVEIYRVKLPGPLKLGEGKPENQNHALIFTRGDAVQTIDMNQDNYFEEALKMRNLLEEYRSKYGLRKPNILGVRENIFTGSVSSLAWFMSAQETSFVTLGQRVLANPLKIRLHYGHPDVFDRFWFLTRGGLSKASRLINLSEDIFAGFNCTLRGGNVTHHEYIQVGKGRDVGLNQVSMFEAKVASGNGEQVLSRDVYRLGHRLDFFRMLSFFYTTVGFFFNTMMISLTVYAFLWGRLYLALSGVENSVAGDASTNRALGTILNQQFIVQLGIFTALPMIVENTLEMGFLSAIWDFITMQLQLSSVFYTFSLGTRSHYFGRTILHGGAKYRATGRGFVVEHKKFAENYRLYARSHFIKAIELGLILTVYAGYSPVAKGTFTYIALTISSWFLVVSWIMAPFVFNPSGFDWLKTVYDYDDFMNWIGFRGGVFAKSEESWERWWYEEQDHLRNTVYQLGIAAGSKSVAVYILSWIYVVVALGLYTILVYARDKYSAREHIYYRLVQFLVVALGILIITALLEFTQFKFLDIFTSLLAFIPTGWGFLLIAQVFRPILEKTIIWGTVVSVARTYDTMFGVIVLTPVAVLSWMPGLMLRGSTEVDMRYRFDSSD
ncbi:hypothetical protein M8C21_015578, partial [Ambrosia artemisiifolia]